jgi:hypothetical protein
MGVWRTVVPKCAIPLRVTEIDRGIRAVLCNIRRRRCPTAGICMHPAPPLVLGAEHFTIVHAPGDADGVLTRQLGALLPK